MKVRTRTRDAALLALSATLLNACGGGGGGGNAQTPPPSISDLQFSPRAAYVGSGNGMASLAGSMSFSAPGSGLASATITILSAAGATISSDTEPVQGAAAGTSGTLAANGSISTAAAGMLTMQVYVTDGSGQRSNVLSQDFRVSNFPWTQLPVMPTSRFNTAAVAVGSRFYVLGGDLTASPISPAPPVDTVEVYDAATGSWTAGAALPEPIDYVVAAAIDGRVYVLGGRNSTGPCSQISNVHVFDPSTGVWSTKSAIPAPVQAATAAVVGTKIYVIGGAKKSCPEQSTAAVNIYDAADDTWTQAADLPSASAYLGSGVSNGKIEVFGGAIVQGTEIVNNVDAFAEYDPTTNIWTPGVATLGVAEPATATVGSLIYAIGGISGVGSAVFANSAYDPSASTWSNKESLPAGAALTGPVADTYNGLIYAFGVTTTWVYSPADDIN